MTSITLETLLALVEGVEPQGDRDFLDAALSDIVAERDKLLRDCETYKVALDLATRAVELTTELSTALMREPKP